MSAPTQNLIEEIKTALERVQSEVYDFLIFLKNRRINTPEGDENLLPLVQSAWADDWSRPEEDDAWGNLWAAI